MKMNATGGPQWLYLKNTSMSQMFIYQARLVAVLFVYMCLRVYLEVNLSAKFNTWRASLRTQTSLTCIWFICIYPNAVLKCLLLSLFAFLSNYIQITLWSSYVRSSYRAYCQGSIIKFIFPQNIVTNNIICF